MYGRTKYFYIKKVASTALQKYITNHKILPIRDTL